MNPMRPISFKNRQRNILKITLLRRIMRRRRKLYIRDLFNNRSADGTVGEYGLLRDLENDPDYFKSYFRMSKEQLDHIFDLVRADIVHPPNHARPIPAKLRLAITIRYLAAGISQIGLSMQYRVSPSSVSAILRETMNAIIKRMKPSYLPSPNHESWSKSETIFREVWNFPFCVGSLDGKHVRVKAPQKTGSLNYNYKGFFSVVVLAVVSGDYRFLAVDVGAPGSESDAAIFSRSAFMRLAESKMLQFPENGSLEGIDVPHVIVGDEAFPFKPWLMRPYPGTELDTRRRIFNYRLSRARRVVENTFGIWAAKWRILFSPIDGDTDLITAAIWTTIVLHNFLREGYSEDNTGLSEYGNPESNVQDIPRVGANNYSNAAFAIREKFTDYFVSHEGELPWQLDYVNRK